MTYVELIVVLSIFAVMASIVIFNYGAFQAKIDIKNLSSDIALKIIETQKNSISGKLPVQTPTPDPTKWKPSYGTYFSGSTTFTKFVDLNQSAIYDSNNLSCGGTGECLEQITLTQGNTISHLDVFYQDGTNAPLSDLTITFFRPSSGALIRSSSPLVSPVSYVKITIASPTSATATIKVYPSGRVQID